MRTIQYGIDRNTGLVWSRVGSQVAVPVLQYDKMTPKNNFNTVYELEKMDVIQTAGQAYNSVVWTRKIPTEIKNRHREFWGMKQLPKNKLNDRRKKNVGDKSS
jgi:hypothetical protein